MIQYPQHDQQYYTTFTRDLLRFLNLPKMSNMNLPKIKYVVGVAPKLLKYGLKTTA